MKHNVHGKSTTMEIINERVRTKVDLAMLQKFWSKSISKFINKFNVKLEDSDN